MRSLAKKIRLWLFQEVNRTIADEARRTRAAIIYGTLGAEKIVDVEYSGQTFKFYVPDGHIDAIQSIHMLDRSFFAAAELSAALRHVDIRGKTVIDVGANIGNHAVYFAGVGGAAKVVCFEPFPRAFAILKRNVELNDVKADLHMVALSAVETELAVRETHAFNLGGTNFEEAKGGIPGKPLDSFEIAEAALLKIDVEGMANVVLAGARNTIAALKPVILIELSPDEFANGHATLTGWGYDRVATFADDTFLYRPR